MYRCAQGVPANINTFLKGLKMETRKAKKGLVAIVVFCGVLVYALTAPGGSLEPPGPPQPTMRTLSEIYDTVDSMAGAGLTYPEKLRIDQFFPGSAGPFLRLQIEGNTIEGESPIVSLEREGTIDCHAFDHEVRVPYDAATLQTTGARVHSPISIIKRTDKTSPLLLKALCLNEPVTSAEFMFFRPTPQGPEENYLTILLENGKIVAIENTYPNIERVSFVFQDITWTYEIGGVEFQDNIGHH